MCKILRNFFKKEKPMSDLTDGLFKKAMVKMTEIDKGGEAGEQLDAAEASQGLSVALKVLANHLTREEVKALLNKYTWTNEA